MVMMDILGFSGAALVLAAYAMRSMRGMRMMAAAANVLFLVYAVSLQIWPMLLLNATLLPINLMRLRQLSRESARGV